MLRREGTHTGFDTGSVLMRIFLSLASEKRLIEEFEKKYFLPFGTSASTTFYHSHAKVGCLCHHLLTKFNCSGLLMETHLCFCNLSKDLLLI